MPRPLRVLHHYIVDARNEFIAHTDFAPKKQHRIVSIAPPTGTWAPMSFWGFDNAKLDARVHEIERLAGEVESRVNAAIMKLESRRAETLSVPNAYAMRR